MARLSRRRADRRGGPSYGDVDGQRALELGWSLRREHQGRGYATEIGRPGLTRAFGELRAERVYSFTERHHVRSRAVMERLGMRYLREIRRAGLVEGSVGVRPDAPFAWAAPGARER